jgi:hypothetical protein
MSVYKQTSSHPILARKEYASFWKEEVIYVSDSNAYEGTGVLAQHHPLFSSIEHMKNAIGKYVLFARHDFHRMNGNVYWDYEVKEHDGTFTAYSYAEND